MGSLKYFFDTEFIEDGRTIDLISIGMVCEDGREFYAEVDDAEIPWDRAHPWVIANVKPHLRSPRKYTKPALRHAIERFIDLGGKDPQFWAWYAAYDWVVFCQLFGSMVDLPPGYPQHCMDIKQLSVELNDPMLPQQMSAKHDALNDAKWNKSAFDFLVEFGERTRALLTTL